MQQSQLAKMRDRELMTRYELKEMIRTDFKSMTSAKRLGAGDERRPRPSRLRGQTTEAKTCAKSKLKGNVLVECLENKNIGAGWKDIQPSREGVNSKWRSMREERGQGPK